MYEAGSRRPLFLINPVAKVARTFGLLFLASPKLLASFATYAGTNF